MVNAVLDLISENIGSRVELGQLSNLGVSSQDIPRIHLVNLPMKDGFGYAGPFCACTR